MTPIPNKLRILTLAVLTLGATLARAADAPVDPHAGHHMAMAAPSAAVMKTVAYQVPAVKLVRADGKAVDLATELGDARPVLMNFIFTTCTAICPVMSHIFAEVQEQLGEGRTNLHMVSISIDPEQDTPARLTDYAATYKAGSQWNFYTGTAVNSIAAQKAFAAFRGDKMNHEPLTLLRKAPGQPWLRIEGLASANEIVSQYRLMVAAK